MKDFEFVESWKEIKTNGNPVDNMRIVFVSIAGFLVFLMAVGAFYLSFQAVSTKADDNGIVNGFVFALLIDGGIIIFSISRLYFSWYENHVWAKAMFALVLAFVLASIWLNLESLVFTSRSVIHGMPPVLLFISFECFILVIHDLGSAKQIGNSLDTFRLVLETMKRDIETNQTNFQNAWDKAKSEFELAKSKRENEIQRLDAIIDKKQTEAKFKTLTQNQQAIIQWLLQNTLETYNMKELQKAMGSLTYNQVYPATKQLFDEGILEEANGRWVVVEGVAP